MDALVFDGPCGDGFEERGFPFGSVVFDVFLEIDDQLPTIRFDVDFFTRFALQRDAHAVFT